MSRADVTHFNQTVSVSTIKKGFFFFVGLNLCHMKAVNDAESRQELS